MNIFTEHKIYPEEEIPLKEHFSKFYHTVYVAFIPFFKIDNNKTSSSFRASNQISVAQAKNEMKELATLNLQNAEIFASNKEYPNEKNSYDNGTPISWKDIITSTKLSDNKELNKALKTAIGSYHRKLERHDLLTILEDYTNQHKIWCPTEGKFDVFAKKEIYKAFKKFNKNIITVVDEFFEKTQEINLNELSEFEFVSKINYNDYYIFSLDREVLFTIHWDSFFYLIGINNGEIDYIKNHFDGFVATDNTTHLWSWKEGEISNILNQKSTIRKPWWKRIKF